MLSPQSPTRWIAARPAAAHTALRLICFPHAGSGAATYREWPRFLPAAVEVCPVLLPGRESRFGEPLPTRLGALIPPLALAIRDLADRPYAFFGHSMGALLAFELCHRLRHDGSDPPVWLVVSGHRAPRCPARHRPVHRLPDADLLAELREFGGTHDELLASEEFMRLVLPVFRADSELCETWEPAVREPLECVISAWGGDRDPRVNPGELDAWRHETRGGFSRRIYGGGHFYLHDDRAPVLADLAAGLEEFATTARRGGAR